MMPTFSAEETKLNQKFNLAFSFWITFMAFLDSNGIFSSLLDLKVLWEPILNGKRLRCSLRAL